MPENEMSTKHPHEPAIPPTLDTEGRCLVCDLLCKIDEQFERANEWRSQAEKQRLRAEKAEQTVSETLERMPTDAVITAICKWMAWDYKDKETRAEASELYHVILNAAPQAPVVMVSGDASPIKPAVAASVCIGLHETQTSDKQETLSRRLRAALRGHWIDNPGWQDIVALQPRVDAILDRSEQFAAERKE